MRCLNYLCHVDWDNWQLMRKLLLYYLRGIPTPIRPQWKWDKFALSSFWAVCQSLAECRKETELPGKQSLSLGFGVWEGMPKWGEKQTHTKPTKQKPQQQQQMSAMLWLDESENAPSFKTGNFKVISKKELVNSWIGEGMGYASKAETVKNLRLLI